MSGLGGCRGLASDFLEGLLGYGIRRAWGTVLGGNVDQQEGGPQVAWQRMAGPSGCQNRRKGEEAIWARGLGPSQSEEFSIVTLSVCPLTGLSLSCPPWAPSLPWSAWSAIAKYSNRAA